VLLTFGLLFAENKENFEKCATNGTTPLCGVAGGSNTILSWVPTPSQRATGNGEAYRLSFELSGQEKTRSEKGSHFYTTIRVDLEGEPDGVQSEQPTFTFRPT